MAAIVFFPKVPKILINENNSDEIQSSPDLWPKSPFF
jgi:hypothetical protein